MLRRLLIKAAADAFIDNLFLAEEQRLRAEIEKMRLNRSQEVKLRRSAQNALNKAELIVERTSDWGGLSAIADLSQEVGKRVRSIHDVIGGHFEEEDFY